MTTNILTNNICINNIDPAIEPRLHKNRIVYKISNVLEKVLIRLKNTNYYIGAKVI